MERKKQITNLDRLAACYGQAVIRRLVDENKIKASDADNTVTKALGVLQENGVYACILYLLAKENNNGKVIIHEILKLLENLGFGWGRPAGFNPEQVLNYIEDKVTAQLEPLLLAKDTLEKMLIYARYGAKARSEE